MAEENPKLSIDQFRSWLEGVEDMQEEGWVPDERQWRKIRQKIDLVIESTPPTAHSVVYPPQRMPQQSVSSIPVEMEQELEMAPPPGPSALDGMKRPASPAPTIKMDDGAPIARDLKTPAPAKNIDTSNGNYKSSFE